MRPSTEVDRRRSTKPWCPSPLALSTAHPKRKDSKLSIASHVNPYERAERIITRSKGRRELEPGQAIRHRHAERSATAILTLGDLPEYINQNYPVLSDQKSLR